MKNIMMKLEKHISGKHKLSMCQHQNYISIIIFIKKSAFKGVKMAEKYMYST